MNEQNDRFSSEISKKLGNYVYRLIDPRNGETFYVEKGKGNRVFSHANGDIEDSVDDKLTVIREIKLLGLSVIHIIHRHGMDEATAFEVEAALIDAYPGLTNIMNGHGNNEYGSMHPAEIIKRYKAEIATFRHKALLISVNRSALDNSLYEAVRYAWVLNKERAESAEVILATVQGLIVGAFVADAWLDATENNFPGREDIEGRYGFIGSKAPDEIAAQYIDKVIPEEYRKRNPIRYTY